MTQSYPHFAFVYFSSGYPVSFQFRFSHDTPSAELIPTLNSLLQYPKNRKVVKLEYRSPSLDAEENVKFTPFDQERRQFRGLDHGSGSLVKSIDRNHLLEAWLEGFYGQSTPQRTKLNPAINIRTVFIPNN
ncbi:mannan endo-1,4-beta-mannosidase 7-like [Vicia villosa]|uniref:mannan endo-1,4-beta-mannosidase 7-like n=1 Tax=Vicia villosa TaxID=3911 RepID=UPI00273C315F|nr:mannan endo-1,4-beta-mannosidase 7-like [Vicia villosa]